MRFHEEVAVSHERRHVYVPVRVWERDSVVKVMYSEHPRVKMEHDASCTHRHELVCVVITHVGRDVTACNRGKLNVRDCQSFGDVPFRGFVFIMPSTYNGSVRNASGRMSYWQSGPYHTNALR